MRHVYSLCSSCHAYMGHTDTADSVKVAIIRFLAKRDGMISSDDMSDEELLISERESLSWLRLEADELLSTLVVVSKQPPSDPPF
jgi:hypothetical protein